VPRAYVTDTSRVSIGPERVLLVEAESHDAFEVRGLQELLGPFDVRVQAAGGYEAVYAGAAALRKSTLWGRGLSCWTVIDRDHRANAEVEPLWEGGPFAGCRQKLIWRRHEFENYFLEPEFISLSGHFRKGDRTVEQLWRHLLKAARGRVLVDAANLVLKQVREIAREWHVPEFTAEEGDFTTLATAEDLLLNGRPYAAMVGRKRKALTARWLRDSFRAWVELLVGQPGTVTLRRGQGQWLVRMAGKELAKMVITAQFYAVRSFAGSPPITSQDQIPPLVVRELMERGSGAPGVVEPIEPPADLAAVRDYFRDTQPPRFPSTDTAGSPRSR
jgi:hypothetical protein